MKRCTKCKKSKPETEFDKRPRYRDGLSYWCTQCRRAYDRAAYREATKGRSRKYRSFAQRHRVVAGLRQKQCASCNRWKAETEFYRNRSSKDGLANRCKRCADKFTSDCR
ncbi:MAG: hypothetical protein ACYS29_07410, partial [Planctomycetota bacterium]